MQLDSDLLQNPPKYIEEAKNPEYRPKISKKLICYHILYYMHMIKTEYTGYVCGQCMSKRILTFSSPIFFSSMSGRRNCGEKFNEKKLCDDYKSLCFNGTYLVTYFYHKW